ncbi:hypothetical protein [Streptomyces coeruleorubidus]|uniref:hypothetical protein n=1 Tax=Streptomyces coeruleorubidus TaxID=116188 RepID=UPI0033AF72C6
MKSPRPTYSSRRLPAAIAAAVFTFVLLFVLASLSDDDTPPSCPASRSGGVDMVVSGPRPCVLHRPGTGAAPGTDSGHVTAPGSSGRTTTPGKAPGGTVKQPKAPAAPKAPAVKVPAAPAPKAPAAPPVRR